MAELPFIFHSSVIPDHQSTKIQGGAMGATRQWIPTAGLLATIAGAGYAVVQLNGQTQAPTADFTNAATAQVRDAQGQIVLQGQFMAPVEEDGGLERRATLAPTGVDADAAGEAEVEFKKSAPANQEVEFAVKNLPPRAAVTFVIDGTDVASATTDGDGEADVELDVRMPGAASR
jgi:hypothetical protein